MFYEDDIVIESKCNKKFKNCWRVSWKYSWKFQWLVEGRTIDEVIEMLKGIECGVKGTSCPDQVARALENYKKNNL